MTINVTSLPRPTLGQKIRDARSAKGISQERFAAIIGTSRRHMIRIEKDKHRPGPVFLQRIAEATEQPLEHFTGEDDEEESEPMADLIAALAPLARLLEKAGARA